MTIIDNNAISHVLKKGLQLTEAYYITPDVRDEAEVGEIIFNRRLPGKIQDISKLPGFRESTYIKHYREMLNKYKGRSFYNMTGLGDISILAALKTAKEMIQGKPQKLFIEAEDEMVTITEDGPLIKKIDKEFNQSIPNNRLKVRILGYGGLV